MNFKKYVPLFIVLIAILTMFTKVIGLGEWKNFSFYLKKHYFCAKHRVEKHISNGIIVEN